MAPMTNKPQTIRGIYHETTNLCGNLIGVNNAGEFPPCINYTLKGYNCYVLKQGNTGMKFT